MTQFSRPERPTHLIPTIEAIDLDLKLWIGRPSAKTALRRMTVVPEMLCVSTRLTPGVRTTPDRIVSAVEGMLMELLPASAPDWQSIALRHLCRLEGDGTTLDRQEDANESVAEHLLNAVGRPVRSTDGKAFYQRYGPDLRAMLAERIADRERELHVQHGDATPTYPIDSDNKLGNPDGGAVAPKVEFPESYRLRFAPGARIWINTASTRSSIGADELEDYERRGPFLGDVLDCNYFYEYDDRRLPILDVSTRKLFAQQTSVDHYDCLYNFPDSVIAKIEVEGIAGCQVEGVARTDTHFAALLSIEPPIAPGTSASIAFRCRVQLSSGRLRPYVTHAHFRSSPSRSIVRVQFASDAPTRVWWFEGVTLSDVPSAWSAGRNLEPDSENYVEHEFPRPRSNYGIAWRW